MQGWRFWPERPQGPLDEAYQQVRWVRPYRPGPWRVALCALLLLVLLYGTAVALLALLRSESLADLVVRVLLVVAVFAAVVWGLVRTYVCGVWVTDAGVRVVRPFGSREWTWAGVADVRSVPGAVRVLGTPVRARGEALVLVLADGTDVETPLTSRSPDFLGRPEAYDMAAGAVEGWLEQERRRRDGPGHPAR
jgi:hypothetical protein